MIAEAAYTWPQAFADSVLAVCVVVGIIAYLRWVR